MSDPLTELRRAMEKASPGPWVADAFPMIQKPPENVSWFIKQPAIRSRIIAECRVPCSFDMKHHPKHDYEFIEAARNHLPEVLARMEALERVAEAARISTPNLEDGGHPDVIAALDALDALDAGPR